MGAVVELPRAVLSRKEAFLREYTLREGAELPPPGSREESYLAYLVEHGGGGDVPVSVIAETYDETKTYVKGDLAWKDNTLQEFDGSVWNAASISDIFKEIEDEVKMKIDDSLEDGKTYARKDGEWVEVIVTESISHSEIDVIIV